MQEKRSLWRNSVIIVAVAALFTATAALATNPQPLVIDMIPSAATARAGNAQVVSQNRAFVHIQLSDREGLLLDSVTLGNLGTETDFISPPAGWEVETLQVGAGGCNLGLTGFRNRGNGVYLLSLMGQSSSGACQWAAGEYVIRVAINAGGYSGAALGSFVVPR